MKEQSEGPPRDSLHATGEVTNAHVNIALHVMKGGRVASH